MIPVEKNKEYTVKIDTVSSDGSGIAHIDNFAIFIPQTVSGDTAKIKITDVKKRFAHGRLEQIITPSQKRREADCPHYENCGGCQLRHIKYEEQLNIKKEIVENAMRRIGGFSDFSAEEIVGMDNPVRYRNKMVFPVGNKNGGTVCGFYARKSHDIIPLTDCAIGDKTNKDIIDAVLSYINENNITAYDGANGIIRRIFTRTSYTTQEIMVVISANAKSLPHSEKLVEKLISVSDKITSIILNINTNKNEPLITDRNVTLWGNDRITDTLCGVKFSISPQSFFQINPVQTEKLYTRALEYAAIDKTMSIMDIYCGIGTISLCAAKTAKSVIGVEIIEKAIDDAKKNALANGIANTRFFADSAENIVPRLIERGETPDVVILDPPRKGSDEKTLSAIVKAQPVRIVYVSCNPATLARDARFLADNGYKITRASSFDLFPHTTHVETVVLMTKK